MGLWKIKANGPLTGMYKPYDTDNWSYDPSGYPPNSTWPSWFKGQYHTHIDPNNSELIFLYLPEPDLFLLTTQIMYFPTFWGVFYPAGLIAPVTYWYNIYLDGETGRPLNFDPAWHEIPSYFLDWEIYSFAGGSIGSYGKLYTTTTSWANPCIREVSWSTLKPTGWQVCANADTVPTAPLYSHIGGWGRFPIVNREDGYLVWGDGITLYLFKLEGDGLWHQWKIVKTTGNMDSCYYEDRQCCWWISDVASGSKIGKLNYQKGRHEILTSIQPEYDDTVKNLIAFDTRRKRVVVLRTRPDDPVTGACRWMMDFYWPVCQVSALGITDPVPVAPLRAGTRIPFITHLIGDVGEPIAPHLIEGSLTEPVDGKLLTPVTSTEVNGKAYLSYQALYAGEERLNLSCTVEDGVG